MSLLLFLAAFGVLVNPAQGQESRIDFDVSRSFDWIRGELFSEAGFDLGRAGIRLPSGRFRAEDILRESFPSLIRPSLLSVRVDSNSTVKDLVDRGSLSLEELDTAVLGARKVPPSLSADLSRMTGRYTVFLRDLAALFTRHRRAVEAPRPLIPVPRADYTGILIIADEELPVHGRRLSAFTEPCLFPKIWDSEMNLVYERNMFDPALKTARLMVRYAARESVFRPTPSGLDADIEALIGPNPLRIIAGEAFGITPTDPVIAREDALKILSSENNRRLLNEGRVVLVLDAARLAR